MMTERRMLVDVVDGHDHPIGVLQRNEIFKRHINFRVAHVFIFDSQGSLLIQQLAASRLRHPGYWGSSVAAYLSAGESYEEAAYRRVAEELGIRNIELRWLGKTAMLDDECEKFIGVFTAINDGPFQFDRGHIDALEFVPIPLIHELNIAGAREFTPTFLKVLRFYEAIM